MLEPLLTQIRAARLTGAARLGLIVTGTVILLDQLSKWLVLDRLGFSPEGCLAFQRAGMVERASMINNCGHLELSPMFDLTMVWNQGVSFGLLAADGVLGRVVLVGFSVIVAVILVAGLFGIGPLKAVRSWQVVAFGLIAGGALGNAIDRMLYGAVADFLNFSGLMFPWVFNVADVAINLGVAAILLDVFILDRQKPATKM